MILFKACPRCGGDVDTTYQEDVYCIQCGHRPAVRLPAPRLTMREPDTGAASGGGLGVSDVLEGAVVRQATGELFRLVHTCPRCDAERAIELKKLRPWDNTCYRCRRCGFIFSPGVPARQVGS